MGDLHFDYWKKAGKDPLGDMANNLLSGADALILNGDISNNGVESWPEAIAWLGQWIDRGRIHLLPGNHDLYDSWLNADEDLQNVAEECGAKFVQKSVMEVGTARFLCCTLWTSMTFAVRPASHPRFTAYAAAKRMNDYLRIRKERTSDILIEPEDIRDTHREHRAWLENALSAPFDGQTYVVTHHAPHPSCAPRPELEFAAAYVTDLTKMMGRHRIEGWIYGHTHFQSRTPHVEGVQLMCSSIGYPWQREGRDADAVGLCLEV